MTQPRADTEQAPNHRLTRGFLLAPLAPAVVISAYVTWTLLAPVAWSRTTADWAGMMAFSCIVALVYAYLTGLIFGTTAYRILSGRIRPRPLVVILAGGMVSAAPLILAFVIAWLVWLVELLLPGASPLRIDPYLSLEFAKALAILVGLGGLGGAVFWLCVFRREAPSRATAPAARAPASPRSSGAAAPRRTPGR